jgi:hypothetical protein
MMTQLHGRKHLSFLKNELKDGKLRRKSSKKDNNGLLAIMN